ncbi:MAG: ABC transporter substrate-binding protein [Dehalococcoidia bacterium]|nr:ABC transporter substrate-binding protein [Dehalococcoidia bacterium]
MRAFTFRAPARLAGILSVIVLTATVVACGDDDGFHSATAGELTVITSLPAPGFWTGTPDRGFDGGMEYRIARALADEFGLQLKVMDVPFDRIAAADFGDADLAISQVLVTPEREQRLTFSTSYFAITSGALVRRGTTVRDLQEARTRQWVVERSTVQEPLVRDELRPTKPALVVGTRDESLAAIRDGRADGTLLDLPTALTIATTSGGEFEVVAQFRPERRAAIALPKGSKNLEAVNAVLRRLEKSGDLDRFIVQELNPVLGREPSTVPLIETSAR